MKPVLEKEYDGFGMVIRRHRFDNGLGIITLADHGAPLVSFQTWYRVGSRHEQVGRTGLAHLFEHLMFNQTRSLAPGQFDREIEAIGGENNAATYVDWTYYRDTVPAGEMEIAVRLESERMQHLVLESEPLEAERDVVINERLMRVEDDIDGFLDEELFRLAFTVHPYHWPTIGWMKDIRSITLEDARDFYRTHYAPNNATLVVVGDFEEDRLFDLVARYYGAIPASDVPKYQDVHEPEQEAERVARYEKPITAPRLLWGYRAPGLAEADWSVLAFLGDVLAGGASSRLVRELTVTNQLATDVDCGPYPFRDASLFRVGVNLMEHIDPGHVSERVEKAIAKLQDPASYSQQELDKVKTSVESEFWLELETCDGRAETLGHYETTLGDFARAFDYVDTIRSIDNTALAAAASTYLQPNRRTTLLAVPDSEVSA